MILPLLVFLVVLVAVFISYKKEHFSSSAIPVFSQDNGVSLTTSSLINTSQTDSVITESVNLTGSVATEPTNIPNQTSESSTNQNDESQSTTAVISTTSVTQEDPVRDLLSKKTCVQKEDKCNLGFKPYSKLEFNKKNPDTNRQYTEEEKDEKEKLFETRCENEEDAEISYCCDTENSLLQSKYNEIDPELREKYKSVSVKKCNNKITKIKICNDNNCKSKDDTPRPATAYEICKLQKVTEDNIDDKGIVSLDSLTPDCYNGKCIYSSNLLELHPDNMNEKITNHYYLIDAVKNDNLDYIKSYFSDSLNDVNTSLEYGYPGNTILHQAVYDNMNQIVSYLLTLKVDLSKTNKDGNTAFHIACFKGNYNAVHKLIKLGASINCGNNMNDTPLHCAVRSGSYNTVLILLNNGATSVLSFRNDHGETPLHTAVVSKKKNLKIVQTLVDSGSEVHSINKYDKTILASLMESDETISRETIRTYLQRIYYNRYSGDKYNKLLKNFPEVRPFEVDTEIPKEMQDKFDEYDSQINYKKLIHYEDEHVSDKNLYVKKHTNRIKANIG